MKNSAPSRLASPSTRRFQLLTEAGRAPEFARTDPNTFIQVCFRDPAGRQIQQAELHRELQGFLTGHSRALVELPRDHGKSFQVCCRIVWELGHNPGLRVKIVCATAAIAAERARFIRDAIARNQWVQSVFPDLKPASPWTAGGFTLERLSPVIGPTVSAYGINGGNTGTRADLLVCDDVVDVSALHSRIDRFRVAEYFENNLMNLLEPEGRFWGLFTPWHADDLNARLKKNAAFSLFRRPIGEDFEPIWDAKWTRERLLARKNEIGSASFARGYRLVPVADDVNLIPPHWVRYWSEPANYDYRVLSVDPAVSTSEKADRSALVVLGRKSEPYVPTAPGSKWEPRPPQLDVLEATARRVSAPDLIALIDDCDRRWQPHVILFESNAAFLGLKDLLVRQARFGWKVKGVTQSSDKGSRIAAFSVPVENGNVRLKGDGSEVDPGQSELYVEMTAFPYGDHDDLLDATATGSNYLLNYREPRIWG
jgi:predicted phage terminase large subunit-like protein